MNEYKQIYLFFLYSLSYTTWLWFNNKMKLVI